MKKNTIYSLIALFSTSIASYAQVGINTPSPASTLDITAKNATGKTTNADGILIPRVDRERAQNMANVQTSTMIYVNSISTGSQSGAAINIGSTGFYYFDGNVWVRLSTTSTNTFVPTVVAAGTASNSYVINDASGFNKFAFTTSTNDGGWNTANNEYTVPKAGYYQVSLQSMMAPNKGGNSFAWNVKYDNTQYQYSSLSNVNAPGNTYNSGGVIVLYLNQGQVVQLGGIPCNGCTGTNYTISTRSFTITYMGA